MRARILPLPIVVLAVACGALVAAAHADDGTTRLGAGAARDASGRAIVERVAWENVDGKARLVIGVRGVADYSARATGADPNANLPDRAYVDLRPAVLGKEISRAPLTVDDGLARQVRVGQFDPQTVRVVVDLAGPGMFEVRTSEKPARLLLSVVPRPPRDGAAPAAVASGAGSEAAATAEAPPPPPPPVVARAAAPPVPSATPLQVARLPEPTDVPRSTPAVAPRTPVPTAEPTAVSTAVPSSEPTAVPEPRETVAAPAAPAPQEDVGREVVIAALPPAGGEHAAAAALGESVAPDLGAVEPPPPPPPSPQVPARAAGGKSGVKSARVPSSRLWTVVIDPGHGGRDPGAKGVTGADEKDITLTIAQMVAARLADDPQIRVVLTRTDDSYVSLEQRTAIANAQGADLFLSIHGNASENPQLAGVETYTLNNTDDRATIRLAALENGLALTGASPGERDLAYILSDLVQTGKEDESVTLARAVQGSLVSYLRDRWRGVVNLGVKKGPFYVLVGAYMPCVLVEVAFLTNETEGQRIAARRYQQDVADGLALGVRRFLASESANANL